MNYEIFKEVLKKKIKEYMPSEFKNYKVVERKVHKVNCDRDAINVVSAKSLVTTIELVPFLSVFIKHLYTTERSKNSLCGTSFK